MKHVNLHLEHPEEALRHAAAATTVKAKI